MDTAAQIEADLREGLGNKVKVVCREKHGWLRLEIEYAGRVLTRNIRAPMHRVAGFRRYDFDAYELIDDARVWLNLVT